MIHVTIASLKTADKLLADGAYDALVSIGFDGKEHCELRTGTDCVMDFYDVTPVSIRHRDRLPTAGDAMELIAFGRKLWDGARVLSHCKQGRSRSTAAALILYMAHGLTSVEAAGKLFTEFPKSQPNWHLLGIADHLLDTNCLGVCRTHWQVKRTRRELKLDIVH